MREEPSMDGFMPFIIEAKTVDRRFVGPQTK